MYKQLADDEAAPDLEYQLSPTKLTNRGMLLDKAKNSLYSTMDSISGSANHPLHEEVKTLLSDIEQEQNIVARKIAEIDGTPSPPPRANDSSIYHSLTTPGTVMNGLATNDPSPQRLASEIRSLNFSQLQMERDRDETKKMLELQNKTLDQNQSMMEQQNKLMEHILNMTPIVQEATPSRIVTQSQQQQQQGGSGDSDVLKKIAEQN
ncbi:putative E3 SUMO-protein ligase RanBP2, partial [Apostichopus japonicus]